MHGAWLGCVQWSSRCQAPKLLALTHPSHHVGSLQGFFNRAIIALVQALLCHDIGGLADGELSSDDDECESDDGSRPSQVDALGNEVHDGDVAASPTGSDRGVGHPMSRVTTTLTTHHHHQCLCCPSTLTLLLCVLFVPHPHHQQPHFYSKSERGIRMGDKQRGPARSNTGITGNGRRGMHSERRCVAVWPQVFPSHSLTHQVSGFSFWTLLDGSENSQASQTPTAYGLPGVRVQGRRRADGKYVESFGNHSDLVPGRLFQIDLPDGFAVRTHPHDTKAVT